MRNLSSKNILSFDKRDCSNQQSYLCLFLIYLILTRFNTHYKSMQDSIYCSERCASAALFSHQKSLLFALYIITVFNARTL